ncbi:F0F1 ATP synthase subunit B [Ectothiorhodospiraceae bacterium WFHF3C12]|nr:F0F1 ATP synthase subunit B [Ectothiorhodospiraceae bacterium WFHF3C12]
MSINATLIGQIIVFAFLVWFTMKFVWPPITRAMEERQKKIAEGLQSAERGEHELELAQKRATEVLKEAREQAAEIVDQANKRGNDIVEEAKTNAQQEAERIVANQRAQMDQELQKAREELRGQVTELAISAASKILEREVDAKAHKGLIDDLAKQL